MTTDISEKDLPSVKFEKDMKDLMDYRKFESYEKNKTTEGEIDNWIKNFQAKLEAYSIDSSEDSSVNHYRRCKHFNYLINVTISKLNSLSDDMIKKLEWSNKIKKYRDQFFHSNNKILICNENNKYIDEDYKILGTFCEDSAFIKRRMNDIQSSVYCSNIANNMSSRKDILINVPGNKFTRGGRIINIDNECSIQLLDTIFHPITCNSSVESPSHVEEPVLSDNHVDDEQSEEKLVRQHAHGVSSSTDDNHGLVTTSEEIEPSDGQSSNTLNTVGLPIFGVLGCSFLFYKFTPVGSIFRSRIQNKGIIPINNHDYSTKQILPNIPNTNDIYSENTQYKISYQTL